MKPTRKQWLTLSDMKNPLIKSLWISAAFAVLAFLLIGTGFVRDIINGPQKVVTRSSGKALVGGPFTLTDHTGRRVSEKTFLGKYMLVYFGYTYCPDVCPTELQVISAALDQLGDKAKKIQPVFVTVDPERDDVKQMAQYVDHFHPSLIGLTGSAQDIKTVAKSYRVYFARIKNDGSSSEYLMDHSSLIYLMGPKGNYVTHFTYGTAPEKIAAKLAEIMQRG